MKTPPEVGSVEERAVFNWTGARRAKLQARSHAPPDSQDSSWFVALAKEQLALITNERSHRISFGWLFMFSITAAQKMVSVAGFAPAIP